MMSISRSVFVYPTLVPYMLMLRGRYQPILKPLVEKDVPKVVQAVRQTQSRKVLLKLLTRIKVCPLISSARLF